MSKEYFTIKELAEIQGVGWGSIYKAIKLKKLAAQLVFGKWRIHREDYQKYFRERYSRKNSWVDGELLYDKEKGEHSIKEAAAILKVSQQRVYAFCRKNLLPYKKKRHAYVVQLKDINDLKNQRDKFC